uniref:Uncharacterized protein n=1 Tax=Arundo donax TaxID=35708 RepID=A0A0A9CSJ7_ARUDO
MCKSVLMVLHQLCHYQLLKCSSSLFATMIIGSYLLWIWITSISCSLILTTPRMMNIKYLHVGS